MNHSHVNESLPAEVEDWVKRGVDSRAEVVAVRRLQGGVSAIVQLVTLRIGEDVWEVVLRRFHDKEWLENEPDLARHEAASLQWAVRTGVRAPEILAYEESGQVGGMPLVLMTKLEGTVLLQPRSMERWLDGLAAALASIHAVDADGFPWTYRPYQRLEAFMTPDWSPYTAEWEAIIRIGRGPRPSVRECFLHRDYHPTNVLWVEDEVSGVVDWVNACRGPAGADVGHCRWNLAMLFGVAAADAFLAAYERHAGERFRYEPYFDVRALLDVQYGPPEVYPGWTALGMPGLTKKLMAERTNDLMLSILERARAAGLTG
ncbi:phosphotransferase family protein [Paenibacillus sp. J31TS4]|uniref:phosphotransferase family protein n=1 Tax=Paenibacillus sp. J31TS4 TaxID=2807195 RepID=UPI001BD18077|nr:aminoglycoside phosphotransferase family protein [Paenibacillus sp. J31TS4]